MMSYRTRSQSPELHAGFKFMVILLRVELVTAFGADIICAAVGLPPGGPLVRPAETHVLLLLSVTPAIDATVPVNEATRRLPLDGKASVTGVVCPGQASIVCCTCTIRMPTGG